MAQDVVTARDVAAPTGVAHGLPDTQRISEILTDALGSRTTYSPAVQSLFQQAWAVAAHRQSRLVTVYHLAYALVFNHREAGTEMAEYLGSDVDAFAVGCILQLMPLGVSTGDADVVPPAVGTVRWLTVAVELARRRNRPAELLPQDLVRAVLDDALDPSERDALRRAARVGKARHDTVLGPKSVPSISAAPSSPSAIIQHMEEVERGHSQGSEVGELLALFGEFEQRYGADVADQKQARARVEALIDRRLASMEQRALPIEDVMSKLATIDRRVVAVEQALPRPPSSARLAAAIVTVIALGGAAGVVLTQLQLGSRLAQPASVSVR